ncbi:MAG: Blue-light-activated protein [Syntrophus sp. PtaB.Bin001]|nr:MAG: Blue-light-activated protein [Syntrophus sp. PtaB.Bin001]
MDMKGFAENSRLKQIIRELEHSKSQYRHGDEVIPESEEQYRFIVGNIADGISVFDMSLRFAYVNTAVLRMRGFTVEEALQQNPDQIFAPESLQRIQSIIAEEREWEACGIVDPGRREILEAEVYKKDGSLIPVELSLSFLRNPEGQAVGILSVTRDITERKRADLALQESEQALRTIFNSSYDAIFIHDLEGRILNCNQKMLDLYQVTKEQALRFTIMDDFSAPGSSLDEKRKLWDRALAGETLAFEWKAKRPNDGFVFPVEVALKRIVLGNRPVVLANVRDITKFKAAETALRESEEKFRALVENCGDGIVRFDRNHRYLYVNRFVIEHTGFPLSPDDFIGKRFEEVGFPADFCAQGHENIERGFVTGEIVHHEFQTPNGLWLDVIQIPEKDPSGQIKAVIAAARDITKLKATEAALRESEEKFRTLVENSTDAILLVDRAHRYFYVNPTVEAQTGISSEEFIGKTFEELGFPENLCTQWHESTDRTFLSGKAERDEFQLPGGMWIDVAQIPERDDTGQVKALIVIGRDVTENKRNEAMFKSLFQAAPLAIFSTDENRVITRVNDYASTTLGYSAEEMVGRNARFLYCGDEDYEAAGKALYSTTSNPTEIRMRKKDGEAIWAIISRSYLNGKDPSGGSIVVVQDITSRKVLEEQLRQAQKMEAIGQLAGGVAHDFNNMLQAILGYTNMILYSLSPEDKNRRKLQEVEKAAERATALTRQLLAFSRRQVLKLVPLDMNSAVDDLLKMLRRLIGENIELSFLPDPKLWKVNADRGQMEQVIVNLCVNARDAMSDGGLLSITTHNTQLDEEYCSQNDWARPGRYVRLDITDSGCGMDPETRAKIFEPFFTTKEQGRGTGLGLATVYGIVRQHEGMIHVYSEVGKGSRFSVYLPTTENAREEIPAEEQVSDPGGHETILLAEDDEPLRFLTKEMLKPAGYRVLVAVDGEDALRLYRDHEKEIDLLLLDVVMPKKGGRCVYDEIRAVRPDIPCLFMSGYSENAVHTNFILNQGFKLIQKPFKSNDLLKMLREELDRSGPTAEFPLKKKRRSP